MHDTPRKVIRVPLALAREFREHVVKPDGRSEAEVIRALMAQAVKEAKLGQK